MSLMNDVSDILTEGLAKGRITPFESAAVLDTLHSFLEKYPSYQPRTSRERACRTDEEKRVEQQLDCDEEELWKRVQPILDKAQSITTTQ